MTDQERNSPPDLLPALVACLDGIVASDELPEGLMRGEIGWLGDGLSDPARTSTAPFAVENRHQALEMADAACGLLDVLDCDPRESLPTARCSCAVLWTTPWRGSAPPCVEIRRTGSAACT